MFKSILAETLKNHLAVVYARIAVHTRGQLDAIFVLFSKLHSFRLNLNFLG
jgi:hypothetical protein